MKSPLSVFFLYLPMFLTGQLQINELMADNSNLIPDSQGIYHDWIELFNYSSDTLDLSQWYLTDEDDDPYQYQLPAFSIPPSSYVLVWASGDSQTANEWYAPFKISKEGEAIYLVKYDRSEGDTAYVPFTPHNHSFGRVNNGEDWQILRNPSPRAFNSADDLLFPVELQFSPNLLDLPDRTGIRVLGSDTCTSLKYSLSGVEAVQKGQKLTGQTIDIDFSISPPAYLSLFPTVEGYRLPKQNRRLPHLTAVCLDSEGKTLGKGSSTLLNHARIERQSDLPSVFLEIDESALFDANRGVMTPGNFDNFKQEGRNWERSAKLILFQNNKDLEIREVGIRIHGHATRELPQKSLKLYSRPEYDQQLLPDILDKFDDSPQPYARLLLRSFHSDHVGNEFRDFGFRDDVIMAILGQDLNLITQKSRPVSLFINGEYWGLYSLHEASDDDQIARSVGLDKEAIEIASGPNQLTAFYDLVSHLNLDLPSDRFIFERYFDLDNLVDYLLAETFFLNRDWPHNNIKTWKVRGTEGPVRFVLFDMDATLKHGSNNYFDRLFAGITHPGQFETKFDKFFQFLLSSQYFNSRLYSRYLELRETVLHPDVMIDHLVSWKEDIQHQVNSQSDRWHYPDSRNAWLKSYEEIEMFLRKRDIHFLEHLSQLNGHVLFPNPLYGNQLCLSESGAGLYDLATIIDQAGRKILTVEVTDNCLFIPTSGLPGKYFFIQLTGESHTTTEAVLLLR